MSYRREKLLQGLDIADGAGIEIGALAWPFITRADGDITYVDWADTPTLRRKYADDPNVDVDRIVQVDAVWGEKTLAEAVGVDRRFDYVVASHVVEHVPDLITWIRELFGVLKPGGEVRLAVPDRRFTFDFLRRETELADVLDAHLHRARKPMSRLVLDALLNYIDVDIHRLWAKTVDLATLQPLPGHIPGALDMARRAMGNEYTDVHCWVFTPVSFTRLMEQIVEAGFLDCACASFTDTALDNIEFFVGLRQETNRAAAAASWRAAAEAALRGSARRHADLEGMQVRIRLDTLDREPDQAAARVAEAERSEVAAIARLRQAEAEATALAGRLAEAERQMTALKQSRSWRITAPLRSVSTLLGRR
jgi:SAM-dependent methyltransferase